MENVVEHMHSLKARAEAVVARATDRDLSAEEVEEVDAIMAEFDALGDSAATIGRLKEMRGATSAGRISSPVSPGMGTARHHVAEFNGGRTFRDMFPAVALERSGFQNLGEFAKAVRLRDPRLFQNAAGMSESVGGDGGFYVPPAFLAGLLDSSLQQEAVRPLATTFPVDAPNVDIPIFDTTARNTGIAGLNPVVTGEGTTGTAQKARLTKLGLSLTKQMILVPTTSELLEDAPAIFNTLLARYMAEALSAKLDDMFINGPGAGEALGLLNAPATVTVSKESGQAAATIVPENVSKMVSRLAPGSWRNAVWLVHSSCLAELFLLTKVIKNVAGSENVGGGITPWFTVSATGEMSLLGRPVVVTDRCQQLGTTGDIYLADLTQYLVAFRSEARLAIDTSYGFASDEVWFRLTYRCTGQPMLKSAITPRKGSNTLSPFVKLEGRP